MIIDSTIVAIATAHGIGSITIIRLSGANSLSIVSQMTHRKSSLLTPRYAHLCDIYDEESFIDKAITIYFKAPYSFTGEDVVEIQAHGGILIAKLIVNTTIRLGATPARPGEFSKRAFLNGKIDLSQAESIAQMIVAKDEQTVKHLAYNLKGDVTIFIDNMRKELIDILGYSEVSIDYAEENLPSDLLKQMEKRLTKINSYLNNIRTYSQRRLNSFDGAKIVFIGKPNVGKSSLLNVLMGYDRAIVSNEAGTTRDSLQEQILINGHLVTLIDTAGIRESNSVIEQMGIKRTIDYLAQADIIVSIFDSSNYLDDEDTIIIQKLHAITCQPDNKQELIIAFNKSDLPAKLNKDAVDSLHGAMIVDINCNTLKPDISQLIKQLEQLLQNSDDYDGVILTSERQINILSQVYSHINESFIYLHSEELEIFAYHINCAIEYLGNITKPVAYSELLDSIFSNFCLGK